MSSRLACTAAIIAASAIAGATHAQIFESDRGVADSEKGRPEHSSFNAGFSILRPKPVTIEFFTVYSDYLGESSFFVARRATGQPGEPSDWADERTCPNLVGVLESLNNLTLPNMRVVNISRQSPTVPRFPRSLPVVSGANSVLWGRTVQADGTPTEILVRSRGGLIAGWAEYAEKELESCWSGELVHP